MDSRVKRLAILSVFLLLSLVIGIVLWQNTDRLQVVMSAKNLTEGNSEAQKQTGQRMSEDLTEEELREFLYDETFFDKENKKRDKTYTSRELTLQVSSIEKDLRIKVTDFTGKPVTGESFYVTIDGLGEFKDLDKDGIFYIGDLKSGNYSVFLNKMEGYYVPEEKIHVTVRDKVEYTVIDDISMFIKTEAEIDALIEDTEERGAEEDADGTEEVLAKNADGKGTFGIDVSKWNKEIDWQKVKAAGVDFAIIRVGYRGSATGTLVQDPYFVQNIEGATNAGIKVGVYFFTQAINAVEAVEEASMAIELSKLYNISYPIFIDTEGAGGNGRADGLDKVMRTQVCQAFCETIKASGYTPGIYASRNWYLNQLETKEFPEEYAIWLAEYRESPLYQGDYHLWQYTSKGSVDGIEGRVDLNISYIK